MFADFDHHHLPLGPDGTAFEYLEQLRDYSVETEQQIGWSNAHGGHWVVVGYEAAHEIFRNHEAFSSAQALLPHYRTPGGRRLMWAEMDEPDHAQYMESVRSTFSPKSVERLAEMLRATTNDLIDEFIEAGAVDIVKGIANEIPARMTAITLGMPPEEGDQYRGWTHAMGHYLFAGEGAGSDELAAMDSYWEAMLADRKRNPGDDLISVLLNSSVDGRPWTDEEIYDSWVMLLIGGIDNTRNLLASALWRLSWDRELRRRLLARPNLMPLALDEFSRYYAPSMTAQILAKEVTVQGVHMQPGQMLLFALPVINRDPRQFTNPDIFIPDRSPNRHLTLGMGIHRCLGAHLVKVEARVALEEMLRRIPEFELDPTQETSWMQGQTCGLDSVPIVFPPGGGSTWTTRRRWEVA